MKGLRGTITMLFLGAAAFALCYPVFFLVIGSFMGQDELRENLQPCLVWSGEGFARFPLLPMYPTLRSYVEILMDRPEFFTMFWNSVKLVGSVLAGQMLIGIPAAWGFARYRFPFRRSLFTIYIIFMMLPFQVVQLSEYLVLEKLHLMDTLGAVILPGIFSTFPVFLLYNFFRQVPEELIEAARLDGASERQVFLHMGIPAAFPGIMAALVLQFVEYWNLVEQPVTFFRDKTLWPLSLYLPEITPENAGASLAASVLAMLPSLLVFFAGQDYLEKGIAATARKE